MDNQNNDNQELSHNSGEAIENNTVVQKKTKLKQTLIIAGIVLAGLFFVMLGYMLYMSRGIMAPEFEPRTTNQSNSNLCQEDDSCCNQSLEIISKERYQMIRANEECLSGFKKNGLRCESSLVWCEPIVNKNDENIEKQDVENLDGNEVIKLFESFPNRSNNGDIAIDKNYIWVANGAGLVRYNKSNNEQKIFTEMDGLLDNATREVLVYGDEVWVASQCAGISVYDIKNNTWKYFTTASGLVGDCNLEIELDKNVVWLISSNGVGRYDLGEDKWTNWTEGDGVRFRGVSDMVFDNNSVWVLVSSNAYTKGGVIELNKRILEWTDITKNETSLPGGKMWASYNMNLLDDSIYVPAIRGEFIYNTTTDKWASADFLQEQRTIRARAIKHDNKYWYFNNDGDIVVSDGVSSGQKVVRTNYLNEKCPAVSNFLSANQEGYNKNFNFDNNILWFGCTEGFVTYDIDTNNWGYQATLNNYPAEIYKIFAVKSGVLLVDTSLGLGMIEPYSNQWDFIHSLEDTSSMWVYRNWENNSIYMEEARDAIGMGLENTPPRFWQYNVLTKEKKEISEVNIPKISNIKIEDRETISKRVESNGLVWFVSDNGIESYNSNTNQYELIGNPPNINNPYRDIEDILVLGDEVWVNPWHNPGKGLHVYNLTSKLWSRLTHSNSDLQFDWIRDIKKVDNYIFLASFGKVEFTERKKGDDSVIVVDGTYNYERHGLDIYDINNDVWRFYVSEDGLLDGEISDMHQDENSVWFSNSKMGIWKLDLDSL